jgi:hypothetical protein
LNERKLQWGGHRIANTIVFWPGHGSRRGSQLFIFNAVKLPICSHCENVENLEKSHRSGFLQTGDPREVAAKLKCFNAQRLALMRELKFSVLD